MHCGGDCVCRTAHTAKDEYLGGRRRTPWKKACKVAVWGSALAETSSRSGKIDFVDVFGHLAGGSDLAEHAVDVEAAQEGGALTRWQLRVGWHEVGDVGGELIPAPHPDDQVLQVRQIEEHRRLPLQSG
jgi:hypothetical protein